MPVRSSALVSKRVLPLLDRTTPAGLAELMDVIRRHRPLLAQLTRSNVPGSGHTLKRRIHESSGRVRLAIALASGKDAAMEETPPFMSLAWRVLEGGETPPDEFMASVAYVEAAERRLYLLELGASLLRCYRRAGKIANFETFEGYIRQGLDTPDGEADIKMHNLAAFAAHLAEDYRGAVRFCQAAIDSPDPFLAAIGRSNAAMAEARAGNMPVAWALVAEAVLLAHRHRLAAGVIWFHVDRALQIAHAMHNGRRAAADLLLELQGEADRLRPLDYYDHRSFCTAIMRSPFTPDFSHLWPGLSRDAIASWRGNDLGDDIDGLYQRHMGAGTAVP